MPKIEVNGVEIAYEIAGEGPPVVWTHGARFPRDPNTAALAGRLSANYTMLSWDRRNTGASGWAITDCPNELDAWSNDLHLLLERLEMTPAYIGGWSTGNALSLLLAHKYPKDIKGLILEGSASDDKDICRPYINAWFLLLASFY